MTFASTLFLLLFAAGLRPESQDLVGTLRWSPSTHDTYVRGTMPVPRSFSAGDGSLTLVHPNFAEARPVQTEVAVRGPSGEAQVLELLAMVPVTDPPVRWGSIVRQPRGLTSPNLAPPHQAFSEPIILRAKDAAGTSYEAAIQPGGRGHFRAKTRKDGHVHRQDMHSLVLLPDATGAPLHPHLFGAHAYLGSWAGADFLTLDLRIHNGLVSPDSTPDSAEAAIGPLYFESIELLLPEGWAGTADVADPSLGEIGSEDDRMVLPLVAAQAGGVLHLMPPGARMHRRLALFPRSNMAARRMATSHLRGGGDAVCVSGPELWSWANAETAHYFPQRQRLPDLAAIQTKRGDRKISMIARLGLTGGAIEAHISNGTGGVGLLNSPALGWAHPWFRPSAGGHGGEGINFLEGLRYLSSGDAHELRRLELLHRANCSRHPTASFRANGESTLVEEWFDDEGALPFAYHLVSQAALQPLRLPCDGGPPVPEELWEHVKETRRPAYDGSGAWDSEGKRPIDPGDLLAWHPHDGAHLSRFTGHAKALSWLKNDSLAKDALAHEAERVRLALPTSPSKAPQLTTLFQLKSYASKQPKNGLPVGREMGWALDTVAAAYSLGDDTQRARLLPWITEACEILVQGTPDTGVTIRNVTSARPAIRTHATAHSFQTAILQLGIRSASRSALVGVNDPLADALDQQLLRCVQTLYNEPVYDPGPTLSTTWPDSKHQRGPRWIFPVAPMDWSEPPLQPGDPYPSSGFDGGVETHYSYTLLAWAHSTELGRGGSSGWHLSKLLEIGPGYKSWGDFSEHLCRQSSSRPGLDPLLQRAPALLYAP